MPATLGDKTISTFVKDVHGNDIHEELQAGADIKKGQPIKLNAAGLAVPAASGEVLTSIIGTALQDRLNGEFVTVATRFRCILLATSSAAIAAAGGVQYTDHDGTYNRFAAAGTTAAIIGYTLDVAAAADEEIRVGIL